MAAIWGIIKKSSSNITKNTDIETLFKKMQASMSIFSFERINTENCSGGFFACGHQYYTNEDEFDISPIKSEHEQVIFCSDCFLYNRKALLEELNDTTLINSGDSQIAYCAFQRWGYSFVEKLRGNFSFAILDIKNNRFHLYSDHFSRQYIVYSNQPDYVCFSTTFKPVLACIGNNIKINREFIVNAYRGPSPMCFHKESITPYEGVFQLDYAIHITIDLKTGNESRIRYWNPLKTVKKLKLKTDNEYKITFRNLFKNLTSSMLRSKNKTGIMLSGGLDSSSVAAFAAPLLKEKGKDLYSYTSVPSTGFVSTSKNPYQIPDESSLVELQHNYHGNLIPHYINGDNDSCISNIDYFQNLYDIPDRALPNGINIFNMTKAAQKDNCSIILSGENGNATISYGHLPEYMSLNITRFHFIKAFKAMSEFCSYYRYSRKKYLKNWLKGAFDFYFIKPKEFQNFLTIEDKKKYSLMHPALDSKRKYGSQHFVTQKQRNNFLVMPTQFTQKGFYYTHLGLLHHFIQLDPTLTVEMVEFCLSLPLKCFVYKGIERRLCREYLADLMPKAITAMDKGFGVQAADTTFRINRDFKKYKEQIIQNIDEPLLRNFLDGKKLDKEIPLLKNSANKQTLDKSQVIQLVNLASLGSFLRNHTK